MRAQVGLVTLLGATLLSGGSGRAQSPRVLQPLPIEAVLSARKFAEFTVPAFAPGGDELAYVIRQGTRASSGVAEQPDSAGDAGVPWSARGATIWLVNIRTGAQRQISPLAADSWAPAWSPDGRSLAFLSEKQVGPEPRLPHLWTWDRVTGRTHRISVANIRSESLVWARDGRRVLVRVLPEHLPPHTGAAPARTMVEATAAEFPVAGSTVIVYRAGEAQPAHAVFDGGWSLPQPMDLAWLELTTGRLDRVVQHRAISHLLLSPDGAHIAFTAPTRFERPGSQQILYDLVVLDVDGRQPVVVASDVRLDHDGAQFSWAPDSRHLAYRTAGALADGEAYVVAVDGTAPRPVSPVPHRPFDHWRVAAPLWDAGGAHIYFVDRTSVWQAAVADSPRLVELAKVAEGRLTLLAQRGGQLWSPDDGPSTVVLTQTPKHAGLVRVNLASGAETPLLELEQFIGGYGAGSGIAASREGHQLAFVAQDPGHGPDLYRLGSDLHTVTRLTQLNAEFDRYVMGERRWIEWRGLDGDTLHGLLLLPAGYQAGHRYPLITKVYGGRKPTESEANHFGLQPSAVDNLQLFATRGYAVLLPDLPLANPGEVVRDLLKMVVPAVDQVVEMGIADPARLGLTGHSFGGYNTIALVTETTRFKAALMSAGLADVLGQYGEMGADGTTYGIAVVEQGQFLMNGMPWEQRDRYLENSPIWHLDRVTTPLLIVHGGADAAVAPFLADQIFTGLRRLGKTVVYARYGGEGHHQASWTYANQLDYWQRTLAWFDQQLR